MDADQLAWSDITAITNSLARQIASDRIPDVVVGVLRGGIIPAVLVSHRLGLRDVRAVMLTHTVLDGVDAAKHDQPMLANPASLGDLAGMDVLVVDDVVGSGDTIATARDLVWRLKPTSVRTAVCVLNEANWRSDDTMAGQVMTYIGHRTQRWVIFPWEAL